MSRAIIVGYSGQDGTILTEKLKLLGFDVLGISKNKSYSTISEFDKCDSNILEKKYVYDIVEKFQATQIYYLAAYQHSSSQIIDADDAIEAAAIVSRDLKKGGKHEKSIILKRMTEIDIKTCVAHDQAIFEQFSSNFLRKNY